MQRLKRIAGVQNQRTTILSFPQTLKAMSDIFKCTNSDCEVKHKCYRQTCNVPFFREKRFEKDENNVCMDFMPIYYEDILQRNLDNYEK